MKKRCQAKIAPDCLGRTEDWETVNGFTRCWRCGRVARETELALRKIPASRGIQTDKGKPSENTKNTGL